MIVSPRRGPVACSTLARPVIARAVVALSAVALLAPACHRGGSNRARVVGGLAEFGALTADPERPWICAGDALSGRLVAIDAVDGDAVLDVAAGGGIGGLLHAPVEELLYASLSTRNRLALLDPATMVRRSTLSLPFTPFALAPAPAGQLLVISSAGALLLDPTTRATTTLLASVAPDALAVSDRDAEIGWIAETVGGSTVVHRFDLLHPGDPPVDDAASPLAGELVGLAVAFDGERLCVGTSVAPGIHLLDPTTLAPLGSIDVGDGLTGMALSSTGLRLFWTTRFPLAESAILGTPWSGPSVALDETPRTRGVALAADNGSLATWDAGGTIETGAIHPLTIHAPAVVHQGRTATLEIEGDPGFAWLVMVSGGAEPFILDRHPGPDPRLIETSFALGFQIALSGQFDGTGRSTIEFDIPTDFTEAVDTVWQVVELPPSPPRRYSFSNGLVVRILGPEGS